MDLDGGHFSESSKLLEIFCLYSRNANLNRDLNASILNLGEKSDDPENQNLLIHEYNEVCRALLQNENETRLIQYLLTIYENITHSTEIKNLLNKFLIGLSTHNILWAYKGIKAFFSLEKQRKEEIRSKRLPEIVQLEEMTYLVDTFSIIRNSSKSLKLIQEFRQILISLVLKMLPINTRQVIELEEKTLIEMINLFYRSDNLIQNFRNSVDECNTLCDEVTDLAFETWLEEKRCTITGERDLALQAREETASLLLMYENLLQYCMQKNLLKEFKGHWFINSMKKLKEHRRKEEEEQFVYLKYEKELPLPEVHPIDDLHYLVTCYDQLSQSYEDGKLLEDLKLLLLEEISQNLIGKYDNASNLKTEDTHDDMNSELKEEEEKHENWKIGDTKIDLNEKVHVELVKTCSLKSRCSKKQVKTKPEVSTLRENKRKNRQDHCDDSVQISSLEHETQIVKHPQDTDFNSIYLGYLVLLLILVGMLLVYFSLITGY